MSDEKRCEWCVHYVVRFSVETTPGRIPAPPHVYTLCALDRPLVPCGHYEREPGADDDE